MGADFNRAAGLPDDFKIHKSTLEEIEKKAVYFTLQTTGLKAKKAF
ncbi:hypothetical protein [Campylobacter iguaniorum]|nr:hypothetical protein [Campylobacter iguaniorum]